MREATKNTALAFLGLILLFLNGCLVGVDQEEMIQEMKENKEEIQKIGKDFTELVEIMKRPEQNFGSMMTSFTSVMNKANGFLDALNPEDIEEFSAAFGQLVGRMNELVEEFDSMDGSFAELFSQLPEFAALLGRMGQSLSQVDFEEIPDAFDAFFDLAGNLGEFNTNLLQDEDFQEDLKALAEAGVPARDSMIRLNRILTKIEEGNLDEMLMNAEELLNTAGDANRVRKGVWDFIKNPFGRDEDSEKNENSIDEDS